MNSGYYPALVQVDPSNGSSVAYLGGFQGQSSSTQLAALQVAGNLAFVGGDFVSVAGSPRIGVAAVELTSHKLAPWNANLGANSKVFAITVAGNYVYLGGDFTLAGGTTVKNVARVALSNGAVDAGFSFTMSSGVVGAMAADATRLFLGGSFVAVGGKAVHGLAAVHLGDLSTTAFKPNLRHAWSEYDNSGWEAVRQMSLQNGQLHILGDFEAVDGLPQSGWATLTGP
jgi:hypothetical protein